MNSWVIIRDRFVLEGIFDESEWEEANKKLEYLRSTYRGTHSFSMKLIDSKTEKEMLKCITNENYMFAIGDSRQ